MWTLIHGHDELLAGWAARRIKNVGAARDFGACRAIGVATSPRPPLEVLAVVVYHGFVAEYGICEVSIAADSPRWAQRGVIRALLHYPFVQLSCRKVYGTIETSNTRACKLIEGLGFRRDGVCRHHFGHKRHAGIYGMMRNEYDAKWGLDVRKNQSLVAATAA